MSAILAGFAALAGWTCSAEGNAAALDALALLDEGKIELRCVAHGAYRLEVEVRNLGKEPLRVEFAPGLVADTYARFVLLGKPGDLQQISSLSGGSGGNGGGNAGGESGGGTQSMGVLMSETLPVPAESTRTLTLRTCCLNYGIPEPTPNQVVMLKRASDFTPVRKFVEAVTLLARRNADVAVAQSALWHLADGMTWPQLARIRIGGKGFSNAELEAAAELVKEAESRASSNSGDPPCDAITGPRSAVTLLIHPDPRGGKEAEAMARAVARRLRERFPMFEVAHRNWPRADDPAKPAASWTAMVRAAGKGQRWSAVAGRCVWNPSDGRWKREAAGPVPLAGKPEPNDAAEWLAAGIAADFARRQVRVERPAPGKLTVWNDLPAALAGLDLLTNVKGTAAASAELRGLAIPALGRAEVALDAAAQERLGTGKRLVAAGLQAAEPAKEAGSAAKLLR